MCYLLVFVVSDLNNIRYSLFLSLSFCAIIVMLWQGLAYLHALKKRCLIVFLYLDPTWPGWLNIYVCIFDMEEIKYFMSIIKIEWINSIEMIVVIHVHEFKQFQPNPLFMQNGNGEGVRRESNFNHIFCCPKMVFSPLWIWNTVQSR